MIAIIDYGMGNLRSVQKGFEKVGHRATITSDPAEIAAASKLVLPGVGAFGDAMLELRRRQLIDPVRSFID
jgi:glutamine amidotransferase